MRKSQQNPSWVMVASFTGKWGTVYPFVKGKATKRSVTGQSGLYQECILNPAV